jgi:hypothetical protein
LDLDIWTSHVTVPGSIDVRIPPATLPIVLPLLRKLDIAFVDLHQDLQHAIDTERHLNAQASGSNFFDSYANYTQMMQFLEGLNGQFPALTYDRFISSYLISSHLISRSLVLVLIATCDNFLELILVIVCKRYCGNDDIS